MYSDVEIIKSGSLKTTHLCIAKFLSNSIYENKNVDFETLSDSQAGKITGNFHKWGLLETCLMQKLPHKKWRVCVCGIA